MSIKIYKMACLVLVCLSGFVVKAQQTNLPVQNNRWAIQPDGSILWTIDGRLPHNDHIEMSGEKVSLWVQYGIDAEGRSGITKTVVFPTFRTLPDDTYSHISYVFHDDELPRFYVDNRLLKIDGKPNDQSFAVKSISHKGIMRVNAVVGNQSAVKIERSLFPSVDKPMAIEKFVFTNTSNKAVNVSMEYLKREVRTDSAKSKSARHSVIMATVGDGSKLLQPGANVSFAVYYLATDHPNDKIIVDADAEEKAREQRVNQISKPLTLITPDIILNTAFDFAKLRATESIFKTKAGYLHSPGGLDYYAAIWANDQAEYVSPFFAFSGDSIARLSAINCYRLFASYMNPEYKPIPSSIVAEGDAMWNGAGDRGDQAMIAYGASRFALANGNAEVARTLWPLITWCLEFSNRKLNEQGVVNSNSDELEGRFPSGKANLSTNSLYYDALNSAVMLGRQLHQPKAVTDKYQQQAIALKGNIEKYFGANIGGFETYKYYETNDVLRAWICLPLTVNIYTRSKGTIDALFSPSLWTADGLATQAGKDTFWDRSTLYALRGVLQAGETEKAMKFLKYYSRRRLLGEHVPYPVEAYPEGNQRHLSAESGLYCRIFTEGLFGIRPTGLNSFNCTPRLPKDWNQMALNQVHAFGSTFDLHISRVKQGKISITVINGGHKKTYIINDGDTQSVLL